MGLAGAWSFGAGQPMIVFRQMKVGRSVIVLATSRASASARHFSL
jgi:hypothetical protein